MKNRIWHKRVVGIMVFMLGIGLFLTGCSKQSRVKDFGGDMDIYLEPNQKLEEITWKEDNLWYLTKPMTEEDVAEIHSFTESSSYGLFEGTVIIHEVKADEEQVKEYQKWKEETYMTYQEYLIYQEHGYTLDDVRYGRVDYSIFSDNQSSD